MYNFIKYKKITRRGKEIIVSKKLLNEFYDNKMYILMSSDKCTPYVVRKVENVKRQQYVGTLRSVLNVKSFKNGNSLDFRDSNVVLI